MSDLVIDTTKEIDRICSFIQKTLKNAGDKNVVLGVSGGIDSATSLYLLKRALPLEKIYVTHLYYFENTQNDGSQLIQDAGIPADHFLNASIQSPVEAFKKELSPDTDLRLGNIMARVRMIYLYDLAKKYNALVCGTENRSEYYLGYFTRFGDEASDFEPIQHLYKTQIYELAKALGVPKHIIDKAPSANLWEGQTDEDELGFTYDEVDKVLHAYLYDKKELSEISKHFKSAEKIIAHVKQVDFKHHLPYTV